MASTRTGKGGFEIDGKVYDFDVGDPNAQGSDFGNPDKGDINVDDSTKDLSKKTRSTLGKYLSDVTKGKKGSSLGVPNRFTIEPPPSPQSIDEIAVSTGDGMPTPLGATPNDDRFADRTATSGVTPGPTGDPATTLGDLSKGKQSPLKTDGHALLPAVGLNNQGPIVGGYTSKVLSINRFTAGGAKFSDDGRAFNVHGINASPDMMKSVGAMLSLRGSQEFPAAFQDDINPQNAGAVAGALIPSPNQLGVLKVPKVLLEARDALEHIASDANAPTEITISPIGDQSWGALNNVEEPWSGTLNLGMIAMALALQATMLLAFEGLGALIGTAGGGQPSSPARIQGIYTKGSYLATPLADPNNVGFPPNLMALLGIHGTRFPFGDALKTGAAAFFVGGDKAKEGLGNQLVGTLTSTVNNALFDNSSAGFLIIVSRQIIRAGQVIAVQIEKIASAFASNPISGIKGILGLLDIIKQSKLIAAVNIFTTLGDAILSEETFSKDTSGPTEKGMVSSIDSFDSGVPGANVKKSRLKKPTEAESSNLKLAWAANRAPAMYLIPDSIMTMTLADQKLESFRGPLGAQDPDTRSYLVVQSESDRVQNGTRIPRESKSPTGFDVKKMETALESEYMPFYFHDLRTNEIISFHAFLTSLSDDYQVNWETIDAYGRVDPVKIYKSTGRRVGMSFYVAALDKKDFDEMWMKLNKLVTLVYPQYTKGRTLTDGINTTFTQPFSQLIGASPLIRIRLGDLLRSNYSRFALARLFGAGDGDMKLDGQAIKFEGAINIIKDPAVANQVIETVKKAQGDSSSEYYLSSAGWSAAMEPTGAGISVGIGGPSPPDQAPTMKIDEGDLGYFKFKIKKTLSNGMVAVAPAIKTANELVAHGYGTTAASTLIKTLEDRYNNVENSNTKVIGGEKGYAVPLHALRLSDKTLGKIFGESNGIATAIQNIDQLSAFLDIEKNALVKSFRSVQGKGLGGVIESMNFDWYDKVTWEIDANSRAPKMCKVTLTFVPIHDVSPGIDHLGYNRAPIYPVGEAMRTGFDPDKSG